MMDIVILAYLIVAIAVVARLLASNGWDWKPVIYPDGHFQLNFVFIIVTGFLAAIPILESVDLTVTTLYAQIFVLFTIFTAVYGTPAVIDKVGTYVAPTPEPEDLEEPVDYI